MQESRQTRTYALRFTAMAVIKDPTGRVVQRFSESYPLTGPLDRVAALKRGRIRFKRQFWLSPGDTRCGRSRGIRRRTIQRQVGPARCAGTVDGLRISELSVIRSVDQAGDPRSGRGSIPDGCDAGDAQPRPARLEGRQCADIGIRDDLSGRRRRCSLSDVRVRARRQGHRAVVHRASRSGRSGSHRITSRHFPPRALAPGEYALRAVATQGSASVSSRSRFRLEP